jgi:sugar phosphate permease
VSYGAILRRREFWGVALGHFSSNYAFYFVMTWLPTFLVKSAGFSVTRMGQIGAVIFGIYSLSVVSMGTLSDVWARHGASLTRVRKTLILTSNFGAALTIACCVVVEPRHAIWFLGLAGIFFGMGTPMIFTIGATLAGPRAAGRWVGAQNLSGQIAGIIAPLVTGFIVGSTGSFGWAFMISAAVPLAGMIAWGIVLKRVEPLEWRAIEHRRDPSVAL